MNHSTQTFGSPEDRRARERVAWLEREIVRLETLLAEQQNELKRVKEQK